LGVTLWRKEPIRTTWGRVVPIFETAAPQRDGYGPAGTAPETEGQTEPTERG